MGLIEVLKRFVPGEGVATGSPPMPAPSVSVPLNTGSGDTFSWNEVAAEPRTFPGQQIDELQSKVERLQEQLWSGGISYDPDMYLPPSGGGSLFFNRLSQGTRELNPLQHQRSIELAYLLYESNPLGKAIVETTRDFVLGDDPTVTVTEEDDAARQEQQSVINRFWDDSINLFNIKLPNKVMELGLYGEQCYPVEINPVDGSVRLGYIDPAAIQKVLVDPRNVERELAIITYVRDVSGMPEEKWYKIIAPDENPNSEWFGRLRGISMEGPSLHNQNDDQGADGAAFDPSVVQSGDQANGNGSARSGFLGDRDANVAPTGMGNSGRDPASVYWYDTEGRLCSHKVAGSCFYFTVNKVSNATRGRSDMLSLIDWVDAYDQLLFNEVDRGLLLKAFIWDVSLEGYNDNQIAEYKKANPQPRPGAVRYHNNRVVWQAVTPDLKAADSKEAADLILSYIATGARLPKTWLAGTMDVNKATAQELSTPALVRLSGRQKLIKWIIFHILTFVLDQAEIKGTIKKRAKEKGFLSPKLWAMHVNLPDLKQTNQIAVAQAINNIVVGLGLAVQQGMIDLVLARECVVMFIQQMGVEVNLTELNDKMKDWKPPLDAQVLKPTNMPTPNVQPSGTNPNKPKDVKAQRPDQGTKESIQEVVDNILSQVGI